MAITFQVGFALKGNELQNALSSQIKAISSELDGALQKASASSGKMSNNIQTAVVEANNLQRALQRATTDRGLSLPALKGALAEANSSISQMLAGLAGGGPAFQNSFNVALTSLATANRSAISLSTKLAEAGRVFTQSFKFTAAQTVIRFLSTSMQQSAAWVKELDANVANIAAVSGKTGEQLVDVYETIVNGAMNLRVAAKDYAEASLIFYQQGLDTTEVERRTQITIQAAKAAGQSVADMASQLTAIWNTYKMVGDEQQRAAAVGAKMAASTAVDFKDIAQAMQISAAAAKEMGVSYNSLAAIIATVGDNTQQSASIIGNAYKTIFSRFQQLREDGTDGEVTLGRVSQQLANLGVNALDAEGKLKPMDTIIKELGVSWGDYSREQRIAIAEAAGGARQFGQLITLMDNFPQYLHLMKVAGEETGESLIKQFNAVQQTVEVAAENSREAWNRAFANLFNADDMKGFYNGLEKIGDVVGEVIQSFGGLPGILTTVALIFQKQIADKVVSTGVSITSLIQNLTVAGQQAAALRETRTSRETLQTTQSSLMQMGAMSKDQATANMTKFDGISQLKEASILVQRALDDGNTKAKALAQSLSNTFSNAARQYTEGIDQNLDLKQILREQTIELETQLDISSQSENAVRFLGEEETARLLVLQETESILQEQIRKKEEELKATEEIKAAEAEIARLRSEKGQVDNQVQTQQQTMDKITNRLNTEVNDQGHKMSKREISTQRELYAKESAKMEEYKKKQLQLTQQIQKAEENVNKKISEGTKEYREQLRITQKEIEALQEQAAAASGIDKAAKTIGLEFLKAGENIAEALNTGGKVDWGAQISNIGVVIQNALANTDLTGAQQVAADKLRQIFDLTNIDPSTLGAQDLITRLTQAFSAANAGGFDLGVSPEALKTLCLNAGMTEEAFKTLAQSLGITESALDGFGLSAQKVSQSIVGTISGILSLTRGMENLVDGFMDGDMSVTKFLSSMMMLMMGLTSITGALKGTAVANFLLNSSLVQTVGGWVASAAGALGFKAALDVATLGITAIISALMVGIGLIVAFFHAEEQRAEAEKEVAQASAEAASAMRELTDAISDQKAAIDEAISGLEDLKRGTAEYAEAAEAAADAVQTLIDTLDGSDNEKIREMGDELRKALNVAEYTGEWEALGEKVASIEKQALKESVAQNNTARENAETVLARGFKDATTTRYDYDGVTAIGRTKSISSGWGNIGGDEDGAIAAYTKLQNELSHITQFGSGELSIAMGDDLKDQIAAYKEALKLQAEMQENMTQKEQEDSEVYSNLTDWLNENSAAYEAYTEAIKGSYEEQSQLLNLDPSMFFDAMDINPEDYGITSIKDMIVPEGGFGSLSEYDAWAQKMEQIGKAAGWTEEQIKEAIETNEKAVGELVAKDFVDEKAIGENAETIKQSLYDAYEDMHEKGLDKYFSQLDVDPSLTKEELEKSLQEQINRLGSIELQAQAETHLTQQAIYAERQKIVDGLETGDTISAEDFEKLGTGYESFFKLMEDGTYQLIEDSEMLANQIESVNQKILMDDATSIAAEAQQYKGTDNDLYNSMMETSVGSQQQLLASADSLRELNDLYATLKQQMAEVGVDGVSYTAFSQALIGLASQFDNTSQECVAYQEALRNGDKEQIKIAESALRAATIIGESAEKYGLNAKSLEIQAQEMKEANKEMNLSDEQAAQMAVTNQRLNKGITTLAKNWKDWSKELKKADKTSQDFSDTAAELSEAVGDIVGWYEELNLSSKFIEDNFDLIEGAANGNTKAILQLGNAVAQESIANAQLDKSLVSAYGPFTSTQELANGTASAFEELWSKQEKWISSTDMFTQVQGAVAEGFNKISGAMDELLSGDKSLADVLGGPEDLAAFVENLNAYAAATGMTAQEMQSMLSSVGVTANVTTDYVEQDVEVPTYYEDFIHEGDKPFTYTDEDGNSVTTYRPRIKKITVPGKPMKTKGWVGVARIDMEGADGSSSEVPPLQFTGKTPPSASAIKGGDTGGGGSSGGGSKTPVKKVQKTEKRDKQRYTDNENAVEDVTKAIDKLSKANDHAFGPQKIRNINLMNVQLARQAKAYQALYDEAKMYTKLDALSLDSGLAAFNAKYGTTLKAEYDGDNLLDNEMELLNIITELQNAKIDEINAVEDKLNELSNQGVLQDDPQVDELNKQLETLKEQLSGMDTDVESMVKKNLENYQEAIRKAEETMQAMVDILYQGLANEIEKYTIARDLHLQINDLEQRHWEAIMDNMGAVGKLGKQVANMLKKSLGSINDSIERYTKHYAQMEEVQKRWENRDISLKAEYGISDEVWDRAQQSGMIPQEIMDEFEGDIDALMDLRQQVWDNLDKQWQNYIDTIQHYIDEYDRITDRLDKQASISDNLMHVIETVGFNYKWGADEGKSYFKNMETQLNIVKNKAAAVNGELAVATNRRKEAEEELNKLLAGRSVLEFSNSANEAEMFEYNRIKEHYDDMASLEAELNAQRIELLAEAYDKATEYAEKWGEIIAHEADEALNGAFDTLDEAMDMYNQKRDIDTFFMDDVDKAFELNKLKREVEDVIDDISDPEQLERYNKLLAEIEAKKEAGVKMTEKDLEILRAQFDLEQARDAYQDARNAKNTMRLTRDASGNYTYVYSEDEQSVEDQEAKVEEAMHNIYKLNRDAADEYAETWLQLQVDWENYYKSIDQARYEQDVKYRDMVDQRMKWYAEQSDLLSGEIIKHNDNIDRSYTDMTLSVITNTEDMATTNDMYKEHHTQLKEKLVENYQEWIEKADETMREVGGSMSDLEQVVDEETDKMMTEVDNLREEIDRLNVEAQSALSDLGGFIGTWCNDVNREFDTVIAKIDALIAKYLEMLRVMAQKADAAVENNGYYDKNTDYSALGRNAYAQAQEGGFKGSYEEFLRTNGSFIVDQRYNAQMDDTNRGSFYHGSDSGWSLEDSLKEMLGTETDRTEWNFRGDSNIKTDGNVYITGDGSYDVVTGKRTATGGLIKTPQVRSLAEEGPELVLNNADTENILNAVKAIRGVVQSQIGAVELGMIGKTGRIADITPYIPKPETQSVDQTVHIDASFPGVSAAAEIETALNNLIVQAAHYSLNNKQN